MEAANTLWRVKTDKKNNTFGFRKTDKLCGCEKQQEMEWENNERV